MKKGIVALVVVMLFAVGVAGAATHDQGRRLAGPFCVGKRNLKPLGSGQNSLRAILRAGVVRSVAVTQPCRPWELRKVGLAVPDIDPVTPGPPGAKGDTGAKGDKGDTGAKGATGAPGKDGKDGADSDVDAVARVWICADGNTGHGLAFGGTDPKGPDCNNGSKFAWFVEASQMVALK